MKTINRPYLEPWECEVIGNDGTIERSIIPADNPKDAFLQFVCYIPHNSPLWQSPGWRHVYISPYRSRHAVPVKEREGD